MLTAEQQMVVDTVCSTSDNRIIAVNSIAGIREFYYIDNSYIIR